MVACFLVPPDFTVTIRSKIQNLIYACSKGLNAVWKNFAVRRTDTPNTSRNIMREASVYWQRYLNTEDELRVYF